MALDDGAPLSSEDAFISLYRRFRPQKFSELRGQDHVVKALRTAVRDEHVAHAYLFSGPRGTGKTSTARILAKALNCLNPDEGDPCGVCASCVEITKGSSMDVIELDAASNGTIEPIRDLIAGASLGSPGRRKVYIIDEVHMLGTGAANALLKTLEEPPSHVVFVLATTDPQKVPATIRSRTQHLEFRLLGAPVLEGLLRDVRSAAGLEVDDEIVSLAVRKGRGSARDALSALDQVVASGETEDSRPSLLNEVVAGLADEDPARSLAALTALREEGWGPQQLAVELVDDLRQCFLLRVAPDLAEVTGEDRRLLGEQSEQLGLARTVRAIELIGTSQVDMRDAPDPLVLFEIAVIRAARVDPGVDGLIERVAKLERKIAELEGSGPSLSAPPAPSTPVVDVPDGEKASLGAYRRPRTERAAQAVQGDRGSAPEDRMAEMPVPEATSGALVEATSTERPVDDRAHEAAPAPAPAPATRNEAEILDAWTSSVLPQLKASVRPLFAMAPATVVAGVLHVEVPTEPYLKKCSEHLDEVSGLLRAELGHDIKVQLRVDSGSKADRVSRSAAAAAPTKAQPEEPKELEDIGIDDIDLADLTEGPAGSIGTDKLLEAFPGATEESS